MFQEIVELARQTGYDFRATACPDDRYRYLFDEWVPYYRGKWAIARRLQPASILEIGVRYGYSALAFLDACPTARYTGIDLDTELYGGAKGAIEWARARAAGRHAEFLVADSQTFSRFPGGDYDLIHIDGQQDQQGFQHDMEVALSQARYILVDGYFWTRDNFLSTSEFLLRYRDSIEYYGVIPGYAGDLLIAVKGRAAQPSGATSSDQIRHTYTSSYYLRDCGGFDTFKRTQGTRLEDPRLRAVAQIAALAPAGRALDLGCGRGELSIGLAAQGFQVTGIDYSADAIALAEAAKQAAGGPAAQVRFLCSDLLTAPLEGQYQVAVAADVVEHLAPAELDRLYQRVASHLSGDGLFVIHTFPNSWYYRYEYARRLRIANSVGAYLPHNPRTRYEQIMHINEQSPRVLRRQLRRCFPHVLLWFSDHEVIHPVANLERRFTIREMAQAGDLFAVASRRPIDPAAIVREFRMHPVALGPGSVRISIRTAPRSVQAGSVFPLEVLVENHSPVKLKSFPPNPVHLAYHWILESTGQVVVFDGERTPLDPLSTGPCTMWVHAPRDPGTYRLRATLVQENVQWFDDPPVQAFADTLVEATPTR